MECSVNKPSYEEQQNMLYKKGQQEEHLLNVTKYKPKRSIFSYIITEKFVNCNLSMWCILNSFKPVSMNILQDILSVAEEKLSHTSSAAVCRKLSSVGRRVLSIESVSAFQGRHVISSYSFHGSVSAVLFLLELIALFVCAQMDQKAPGRHDGSIPNQDVCLKDWAWMITPKSRVLTAFSKQTVCQGSRYGSAEV